MESQVYGPPVPPIHFTLDYSAIAFATTFPTQNDSRPVLASVCINLAHKQIAAADGVLYVYES